MEPPTITIEVELDTNEAHRKLDELEARVDAIGAEIDGLDEEIVDSDDGSDEGDDDDDEMVTLVDNLSFAADERSFPLREIVIETATHMGVHSFPWVAGVPENGFSSYHYTPDGYDQSFYFDEADGTPFDAFLNDYDGQEYVRVEDDRSGDVVVRTDELRLSPKGSHWDAPLALFDEYVEILECVEDGEYPDEPRQFSLVARELTPLSADEAMELIADA